MSGERGCSRGGDIYGYLSNLSLPTERNKSKHTEYLLSDACEVGVDGIGLVGLQFLGGMTASGDAVDLGESAITGGRDIKGRVADHDRLVGLGFEFAEDEMGKLNLRFTPRVEVGAEGTVEEVVNFKVGENFMRIHLVLIGVDGGLNLVAAEGFEQFDATRVNFNPLKHHFGKMLAEESSRRGGVGFTGEFHDGDVDRSAHGAADLFEGDARQSHHLHDVVVAAVDGLEIIDERPIEVKKHCFGQGTNHGVS